jgi:hypothetical protein
LSIQKNLLYGRETQADFYSDFQDSAYGMDNKEEHEPANISHNKNV